MAAKANIISASTIKPSSPTPDHLRDFKLSFFDQIVPSIYVPIVFFYSASDANTSGTDFTLVSEKLKIALSDTLTSYYPFCGKAKGNATFECIDAGVLYLEAKVPCNISEILKNPQLNVLKEFLPFDPKNSGADHSELAVNLAVQVSEFICGGIALGVCISHRIADGTTISSFLHAWAANARGHGNIVAPYMEAASVYPPRDINLNTNCFVEKNIVTRRFMFNATDLCRLRAKLASCNPTRVEAVTALIWKSAIEAARTSSKEQTPYATKVVHAVNIRSRMVPPLPEHSFGNLCIAAVSPLTELEKMVELYDITQVVRKMIREVDGDYMKKFEGDSAVLPGVMKFKNELFFMASKIETPCYVFTSWLKFRFYEADFGWGKPTWVGTTGLLPSANTIILMPTRCGDGIEAWVTLSEKDMVEFEHNPDLLQFASLAS